MERPQFVDQLRANWNQGKFVCVGLDADFGKLPIHLKKELHAADKWYPVRYETSVEFITSIVDATADLVLAYKPNIAFFEDTIGGERALKRTVDYIHSSYPDIPVIGDVKRADIGNTNKGYAKTMFERYGFDAITLNAQYFGQDTLPPFEAYSGKGLILMVKTSNPGSKELQDMPIDYSEAYCKGLISKDETAELEKVLEERNPRVYEMVAFLAARRWNKSGNLGLVVGATHPEAFAMVRKLVGDVPFLIPGIGTQGGDLEKTLRFAPDSKGQGMIINSSSGIIFASSGKDFASAARAKTQALHDQITKLRVV